MTATPAESPASPAPEQPKPAMPGWRGHWGWILSLFLVALGFKLRFILNSGSSLPYYDQWEGEAGDTYIPWLEHQLSIASLFAAHNEHRIFFTRIWDLALFLLNGQWDSQPLMVFNAFLHLTLVVSFGALQARLLGLKLWPFIWLPLALVLVLPFTWENTLWAFESQFYFLLMFSLLAICLLSLATPLGDGWKCGALAAAAALFTMGSGFLAATAVAALIAFDVIKGPRNWRQNLPTLALCGVLTVVGLLIKPHLPSHSSLAHSLPQFLAALSRNLAWPCVSWPWFALLNLLPLSLLAWLAFRSPEPVKPPDRTLIGVGFWILLQSLAAAYARGGLNGPMPSRYMDTSSFILITNCLCIFRLLTFYRPRLKLPALHYVTFALWAGGCLAGLSLLNWTVWTDTLPGWQMLQDRRLAVTRVFLITDDARIFDQVPPNQLPFPYAPELVFLLRLPDIRTNLPASTRDPITIVPGKNDNQTFVIHGAAPAEHETTQEKFFGSYSADGAKARGTFESLPARASALPYLEIPVIGDLSQPNLSLDLVELATGKSIPVKPAAAPGEHWLNVRVRAPAGSFKIVARDDSETGWFAFQEPREVGRLSYWTMRFAAEWKFVLGAGLCLLCWTLLKQFVIRSRA